MNFGSLKVEEVQEPTIPPQIKDIRDNAELAIITTAFKGLSGNRLKFTCTTQDEAEKLGDW